VVCPDDGVCPVCCQVGEQVSPVTVRHLVYPERCSEVLGDRYWICTDSGCAVAYFGPGGQPRFEVGAVRVPIWFKDGAEPRYACYCSRVTVDQVEHAITNLGARSVDDICELTGAMAVSDCVENNPLGVCCHFAIQAIIDRVLSGDSLSSTLCI